MPPSRSKNGNGAGEGAEEIGADARKYNGLFSEKDWKCKLCGNINWARRHVCNQCQTPKPGTGQDAQREGYGGGFMDREPKVEYRSTRYASDDDYDDFGRRRKKRKGAECTQSVSPADAAGAREPKESEGSAATEVQDDDDGDDDGKWDAWADILGDSNIKDSSQGVEESKNA
ncbi:Zinc finger Ran-binding domain-containing protein 2 [Gaertneriomyces sp. JEL0708]|nr:Zinc finger Ran-binding domain-containing protein 2 [Gaertneriomyces sp. JEL0708]